MPIFLIDQAEENFFELVFPIRWAPAAFWLCAWIAFRIAQINGQRR